MTTFREVFDEQEREELLVCVQSRLTQVRGSLRRAHRTETSRNAETIERYENHIAMLERMICSITEEAN
jgi:hypothetical protein